MDHVLENMDVDSVLEQFHKLLTLGAHRFVIRGSTLTAFEFIWRAKQTFGDYFEFELILADIKSASSQKPGAPCYTNKILSPKDAYGTGCDVVMIFCDSVNAVFDEIYSFAPNTQHIVYKTDPPDDCLFVSFPKCGSHLFVLLLNALGLKSEGNNPSKTTMEQCKDAPEKTHVLRHFIDDIAPEILLARIENEKLKIVFNFRDPRAQALSYVNYFSAEKFKSHHAANPEAANIFRIYSNLPDTTSRLKYFLETHIFGEKYHIAFKRHAYLLSHPKVCSVRYENLVGSGVYGGDLRKKEVEKVVRYLGVSGDPEKIAQALQRTDTATFHTGAVDAWREHFTEEIMDIFQKVYPESIMSLYGYGE